MEERSINPKPDAFDKIDKRDLVNIDLYDNEIKVMEEQLNELAEKHSRSKEMHRKVDEFKKKLDLQKENLEQFRKKCKPEETIPGRKHTKNPTKDGEENRGKGFFDRLKAFENDFKDIRNEVNDFMNRWL